MASRTLAVVRRLLNFGVRHDWIEANPSALMDKPGREQSRDRVLSDDEIRRIWKVLSRQPTTEERAAPNRKRSPGTKDDPICPVAPALAGLMKKNGHAHRVPLVQEALDILAVRQADRQRRNERNQEEGSADAEVVDDECVFVGTGASVRDRAKKAPSRIARLLDIDFRGHDLRRTAATKMAESGVPRHHISAVLNHVEGGARATRIYDRYSYDSEKRRALGRWAPTLKAIVDGSRDRNVITFGARRMS